MVTEQRAQEVALPGVSEAVERVGSGSEGMGTVVADLSVRVERRGMGRS